jgi:hypothetical protein
MRNRQSPREVAGMDRDFASVMVPVDSEILHEAGGKLNSTVGN